MNSTNTVADLLPHEIAGPVDYWPYPVSFMIGAGAFVLILLALAFWGFVVWRRRASRRVLTARETAMAALAQARISAADASAYLFSIEVCDVLRRFLGTEHHLPASTQTSYEFLQTARGSAFFDADRLACLGQFLDKADAIKFARAAANAGDNIELVDLAENLVKGGKSDAVPA
jgi:type II secretory pathway pseudopilin PulG